MRKLVTAAAAALLALTGCATEQYVFQPAEQATATASGYPAAHYEIPPESPRGDVRVVSFGVVRMKREGQEDVRTLQVRMIVSNNDTQGAAWSLDTRNIRVQFPGQQALGPLFIQAPAAGLPVVAIAAGAQRTIDFYYPLPPGAEGAREIPRFDLTWQVQTPQRVVAERTPFERAAIEPEVYASAYYGVGGYWWYDPFYAPYAYYGPRTVIINRGPIYRTPAYRGYYGYPRR